MRLDLLQLEKEQDTHNWEKLKEFSFKYSYSQEMQMLIPNEQSL